MMNRHGLYTRSLSDTETASATSSTVSLLDVLKAPTVSNLSRKRSVARNPPCGKRRSRPRSTSFDPKNVKPSQRVKEYQNKPFTVSNCKLFCKGYREEISVKKSSIENHLKSLKHLNGKEKLRHRETQEADIAESLTK